MVKSVTVPKTQVDGTYTDSKGVLVCKAGTVFKAENGVPYNGILLNDARVGSEDGSLIIGGRYINTNLHTPIVDEAFI
ncbi:MAG: hypothetical protein ACRC42_03110 [Mycoplasma sp.]